MFARNRSPLPSLSLSLRLANVPAPRLGRIRSIWRVRTQCVACLVAFSTLLAGITVGFLGSKDPKQAEKSQKWTTMVYWSTFISLLLTSIEVRLTPLSAPIPALLPCTLKPVFVDSCSMTRELI